MSIEKERKAFEGWFKGTRTFKSIKHQIDMEGSGRHQDIFSVFQRDDIYVYDYAQIAVQSAWEYWNYLKNHQAKKLEGCVVVPVELSDDQADGLVSKLFEGFKDIFKSEHRDLSATEREQLRLRWSRNKARTLQEDYKLLVEAARVGNE